MNKLITKVTKGLFFLAFFTLCTLRYSYGQTLTIQNFPTGTYTPGSNIAIPFNIGSGGCIQQTNTFQVYLANAAGTIISGALSTTTGAYATYMNAVIPAGTPAGTYKFVIKSTAPAVTSAASPSFTVAAGTAVTAAMTSGETLLGSNTMGACNGSNGLTYDFANGSSTASSTASFFDETTQASSGTVTLAPNGTFTAAANNYTVIVKATNGSNIGTQAYTLVNNPVVNTFALSTTSTICLGAALTYIIDPNAIKNNYPGIVYHVDWGDGTSSDYSYCDLVASGGNVTKFYTSGSCASGNKTFTISMQQKAPYCTTLTTNITTAATVLQVPINSFTFTPLGCSNSPVTFTNTSDPGQDPTTLNCINPNARYTWLVDGTAQLSNVPISTLFTYTFTPGSHTVTLHLNASFNGACPAADVTQTICIQGPPTPAFTLPAGPVCLSSTVPVIDNSTVDPGCGSSNTYLWTVTGPGPVNFTGGTSSSSPSPKLKFSQPGTYTIKLAITAQNCGTYSTTQTLVVDDSPTITMSADALVCGTNFTYTFDPSGGITQTTSTGTVTALAATYTWTVAGGTYAFAGGTTANSQYPQITFTGYGIYTITAKETNSCGTVTKSQKLNFQVVPVIAITPVPTLCPGSAASLSATITPATYTSVQWSGGAGAFTNSTSLTTATYTPTAAEITAGTVTLTLTVNTGLTGACSTISQNVTISIYPWDTITSGATKTICTGTAVNYGITASIAGSTFTWVASNSTGTTTGFNSCSSSCGNTISDVLVNTSATVNSVVSYVITPYDTHGCPGTPLTLLVTVKPDPILTATPASTLICSGSTNTITLTSNIAGTKYTWTSTVTGSITGNSQQAGKTSSSIGEVLNNSGTTAGSVTYVITPYNGTCAGNPVTKTINVQPLPTTSNPGANDTKCNITSYTLNGNTPSAGTGAWTLTSGQTGVTITSPTLPGSTVTGLVPGNTYTFAWTITVTGCQFSSNSVTVQDDALSVGGITAGATTVCSGANSGNVTLSGQLGNILRWESSIDAGVTWSSISNTTTTQAYLNLTQATQYRAVVQNGSCAIAYSTVTPILVSVPAVISNAGTDQTVCNATSYTLAGNSPTPGTGLWTVSSGQTGLTFTPASSPTATVSGMVPGQTYKFTWTITPALPCTPNSSFVIITDNAPSVGGTTSGANAFCAGSGNSGTISLSGQTGGVVRWESSTDNGVTWSPTTPANTSTSQTYINITQTTAYRAVVQNGSCLIAYSTPTTITINPVAVTANAGLNAVLCNVTSYTLNANNPSPGTGLWTVSSGQIGVVFSDPTQPNATVSNLVPGQTYQFTWTITPAAPCTPNSSSILVTDDLPSVGGTTGTSATVCMGSNGATISLTGQVGAVIRWESSIDNGTTWVSIGNTTTSQVYSNLTQNTQYRAVVQSGVCAIVYSTVTTITVTPAAVIANAGTDQQLCNATTYTLSGNSPSPGTGLWTLISGQTGIAFSDPTLPNAVVTGMVGGQTYKFTWTITPAAPCTPNGSTVTITDYVPSVGGNTAGGTTVCSGSSNGNITLTGQTGNVLRWESSIDNGVTWTLIPNTTTSQPYLNLTQTTQYRAAVQNGNCAFAYSTVSTVNVSTPAVTANAGGNNEICNATTYILQGNNPAPGTGLWTVTSGQTGITFSDPTLPNATVSGLLPGQTYQFTWTITPAAPCAPNSSVVTIINDAPSVGGTTAGTTAVCSGSGSGNITLSGQTGLIIRWESSIDNGTSWQSIANTTTTQSYINLTQTTQYRAVVQNGLCSIATSTPSTITVNPIAVTANAGTNQSVCNAISYTLSGNNPSPGTGLWTLISGQTGVTFSNASLPNAVVSGMVPGQVYQFTWTITPAAPCTPNSSTVTITDDALSVGGTTAGANSFCFGSSNSGAITLSGQLGNVIRWESSVDNGVTWLPIVNTSTSQSYANITQTTQYRAVVLNGSCAIANSTPTTITINLPAIAPNAGANDEVCNVTSYTLNGNNPAPAAGLWTLTSGQIGVTFSDPTSPTAVASGLIPGQTYQFTWTITPGSPCVAKTSSVTIINDAPSTGGTTAGSTSYCFGFPNNGSVTLSGQVGSILRWESSIDNGVTWSPLGNTSATQSYSNVTQTTQYRAVVKNGVCAIAYSTISTIIINPPAIPADAGTNQEVCNASSFTLSGNTPVAGTTGLWTVASGQTGVTFSDPTSPTATASGLIPGQTYQFTWTMLPGAPCVPNSSTVALTDDAPSVGGTTAGGNTYCAGSNATGVITLSGQVGTVLRWESSIDNGVSWVTIANTGTTQQFLNLTQSTQYRAVVQNPICAFAYSSISAVGVIQPAVTPNAGTNQEVCNVTTYTLNGNNPSPGTGMWTVTSGQTGITFSNPTLPNAVASGLIPGQVYQFTWTISATAPCPPISASVTITDDAPSVGGTTAGGNTYCSGTVNSGTITLSGQVGNVVRWELSTDNGTTWTSIPNTAASLPYLNITQTTQYRAVVLNGVCSIAYSSVSAIVINPAAVTANAGGNQELCNITSYTLNGNSPAPATGLWTLASGQTGVTFADPTQPNTTVSGLVAGQTYKFTWTITPLAPCTPNSSTVVIIDDAPSIGGTTAGATTVCSGSNSGSVTLSGQVGGVIRWESSVDNGTTWSPVSNLTTSLTYTNITQTTQYRAVVQNGVCTFVYSTATQIVVNPPAVIANAGASNELCNATSYVLQGNNPGAGTGLWTVTTGQTGLTFSNATSPTATVSGLITGQVYQFTWTITPAAPCTPNSSTVTITNDAPSVGGTASGATTFCAGTSISGAVTVTGQVGSVIRWESSIDNGTTWVAIANTTTTQSYLNLTQTTQYRAVVQNGVCTFANSTPTIITITPPAVAANAGSNQVICNATTYTLGGNSPSPGTGLWTLTSGQSGVIFSDATQPNAVVSGLIPGQIYQFTWTITSAAPCAPNSSSVTITDDAPSIGGITAGGNIYCSGSGNSGAITLSGQLGLVLRWEYSVDNGTTWTSIVNTSTSQPYLNVTQTTQYRAVVQNGTCTFTNSTASTITINPAAAASNAGINQELCNITTYTLTGNSPAPATGLWTLTSGQTGVVFSDPTQPNATVSGLVAGQTYQFTWTITPLAPCTPTSSTVNIIDDQLSIGGTTAGATTVCSGSNNGNITLTGQLGNILGWETSTDNGVTWVAVANTTTTLSYSNITQTTKYRAVVQNGVCSIAHSSVSTIVVSTPAVTSNAGANQTVCNATSYVLQGNNPFPGTGLWTVASGQTGIVFSDATQPNATVSGLIAGQVYQFTWTITPAAPCAPNSSTVTITDNAPSVGGATAGANTFCAGSNISGSITLTGQLGAILRWESSTDNGVTWSSIANTTTTQPYLNLTQTTEYRAVVQNGVCTFANSTASTITINPPAVTANAGANQEICNATSYILQGNSPFPSTGLWTLVSSQTGVTFSDPTQPNATVSGLIPGQTYQFTWAITPGAPCAPNSSAVTITDDAPSVGGTTAGTATFCAGSGNSGTITLAGQVGTILRWESSVDNGTTWTSISNTSISQTYTNLTQTTQYRAVVQNGICTFANSTVSTITINPVAVTANAGTDQELCNITSYTLSGNIASPGAGLWTVTSGQTGIVFSNPASPTATVSGMVPGQTYKFTWTITPAAPCAPNSSTVTIIDDAPTVGGITAGATTVCASNNNGSITLSGQLGVILRWESSTDNGVTWTSVANTTATLPYTNLTQTTQYRAVVQNGVCLIAYSAVTAIVVNPPAVPASAGTNQELCNATFYVLQGNSPSPGSGLWTLTSGQTGVTFSNPTLPNATVSGLVAGQVYQFTWTITPAAPCTPNSSSVTITNDAASVGGTTAGANTFCAGSNVSGSITLTGQVGNVVRWESSIDNGTTWVPIVNTSTTQPYLNLTQTTKYRAVVLNGVCTVAYSTVSAITINPPAVPANAGANNEICNATTYILQGNSPSPGTGLWTVSSSQTGVTFSDPTQPNATVSGLIPGQTYQFTWTITPGAPCAPNSSAVTITDDLPSVGGTTAGGNVFCAGTGNSGTITLTGQVGAILRWEFSTDNGTT
ncbi:MAG TPA: PKD-like domain-containing protein, partial [Mucilaginibacter sp.]